MTRTLRYRELVKAQRSSSNGKKVLDYRCVVCTRSYPPQFLTKCPECHGAIDVFYDLSNVHIRKTGNPLERYFDLLPFLSPEELVWLGDGHTPCIHAKALGRTLGLQQLYLKDETANPTRSTKDRIVSVSLSCLKRFGIHEFALASSGNTSMAYARGVQLRPEFSAHIFVARPFLPRLNYEDHPRIKTYVVDTDYVKAGNAAIAFARQQGITYEGGFFNPARREGLKLAYLEAYDHIGGSPAFIFQAVSSGMGLLGAYKGALEYATLNGWETIPRFVAVQQSSCSPMVTAFQEGSPKIMPNHIIDNPQGLATAILRGNPRRTYPYIHRMVLDTEGTILAAGNYSIQLARKQLWEYEGIQTCYAGATALAGMMALAKAGKLPPSQPILVNITGGDRPLNSPTPTTILEWRGQ